MHLPVDLAALVATAIVQKLRYTVVVLVGFTCVHEAGHKAQSIGPNAVKSLYVNF